MKQNQIQMIPGVFISPSLQSVRVSPAAFQAWPWSGLAFPCKGEASREIQFNFEKGSMDLADGDFPETVNESAISSLADDCKALCLFLQSFMDPFQGAELFSFLHECKGPSIRMDEIQDEITENERKRGAGAGEWVAMESWGGRVSRPSQARESARLFIKDLENGKELFCDPPRWYEGDCVISSTLILQGFTCLSQRTDQAREAIETLCLLDTFEEMANGLDEIRQQEWESAFYGELERSARSVLEGEESK